jgi:hypothetical protein
LSFLISRQQGQSKDDYQFKILKYKKTLDENGNEVLENMVSFTKRVCGFISLMTTLYCIQVGGIFSFSFSRLVYLILSGIPQNPQGLGLVSSILTIEDPTLFSFFITLVFAGNFSRLVCLFVSFRRITSHYLVCQLLSVAVLQESVFEVTSIYYP